MPFVVNVKIPGITPTLINERDGGSNSIQVCKFWAGEMCMGRHF